MKLLMLGTTGRGTKELLLEAKRRGIYTIVTDNLSVEKAPLKLLADEYWMISTADIDVLEERSSGWIEGTKSTAGSYDSQLSLYISNDSLCTCKLYSEADCFIFIKIRKYVSASTVL